MKKWSVQSQEVTPLNPNPNPNPNPNRSCQVDSFFSYGVGSTVVVCNGKKMVVEKTQQKRPVPDILEEARLQVSMKVCVCVHMKRPDSR